MNLPFFGPQIRPARPEDTTQLVALYEEFFTRFNLEQTLTGVTKELLRVKDNREFVTATIESYFRESYILFVAEQNGKIIGLISGTVHRDPQLVYFPEAEIVDWYIREGHRQKGLGRKLYERFLSEAKRQGCKSISVEAFAQNQKTIATYERLGFTKDSVTLKKML